MGRLEPRSRNSRSRISRTKSGSQLKRRAKGRNEGVSLANTIEIVDRTDSVSSGGKIHLSDVQPDKYKTIRAIGQGGMKMIHIIKDKDTTRNLAKATLLEAQVNDNNIRRFIREARITAALEHPNIVPIHDIGLDKDGNPFFTMKLLEGISLFDILKKLGEGSIKHIRKYNLPNRLQIFRKICEAINFAHAKGIIHLDLKPANVHVSQYGEVLVIDWGLAKFIHEDEMITESKIYSEIKDAKIEHTMVGVIKGSPGYMAPEQASPKSLPKDERTDIYALGCILYSLLTWKNPISSNSIDQILRSTLEGRIKSPRERSPERFIPAPLEAMAQKAMKIDPDERYQSVQELIDDLDAYTDGFATSAEQVGVISHMWLAVKRRKVVSLMTLIIVMMMGGSFYYYYLITKENNEKLQRMLDLARIKEKEAQEHHKKAISLVKEKEEAEEKAAPEYLRLAFVHIKRRNFKESMKNVTSAVEYNDRLKEAWKLKSWLHMGFGEFVEAARSLRSIDEDNLSLKQYYNNLASICEDIVTLKKKSQESENFIKLVKKMRSFPYENDEVKNENIMIHLFTYKNSSGDIRFPEKLKLLESTLALFNPDMKGIKISHTFYDTGIFQVSIESKSGLTNLLPITGLPVYDLNIVKTEVTSLDVLKSLPLNNLVLPQHLSDLSTLKRKVENIDFRYVKDFDWESLPQNIKFDTMTISSKIEQLQVFDELKEMDIKIIRLHL